MHAAMVLSTDGSYCGNIALVVAGLTSKEVAHSHTWCLPGVAGWLWSSLTLRSLGSFFGWSP